jgi:hypothetical protein
MFRGNELETFNLISFVKDTYETQIGGRRQEGDRVAEDAHMGEDEEGEGNGTSRPRHTRSLYLSQHSHASKTCRVIRPRNHKTLLSIPGRYFPRNDVPETYAFYCAAMLVLLKPWRELAELKQGHEDWKSAFEAFYRDSDQKTRDVLANIQFFYESSDVAERKRGHHGQNTVGE